MRRIRPERWGWWDWWWIRRSQRSQARRCLVLPLSAIYARFALIADAGGDATLANPKGVFRAHSVETRALCVVARRRVVVGIHRLAGAVGSGVARHQLKLSSITYAAQHALTTRLVGAAWTLGADKAIVGTCRVVPAAACPRTPTRALEIVAHSRLAGVLDAAVLDEVLVALLIGARSAKPLYKATAASPILAYCAEGQVGAGLLCARGGCEEVIWRQQEVVAERYTHEAIVGACGVITAAALPALPRAAIEVAARGGGAAVNKAAVAGEVLAGQLVGAIRALVPHSEANCWVALCRCAPCASWARLVEARVGWRRG